MRSEKLNNTAFTPANWLHNKPHPNLVAYHNNCMMHTDSMAQESENDSEGKALLSSMMAGPSVWVTLMARGVCNS